MIVSNKYRLYLNDDTKKLSNLIISEQFLWNHVVALQKRYFRLYHGYIDTVRMQKHIAKIAKKNQFWSLLHSQTIQEVCQRVDTSYQRFFKKIQKKPPRFHKKFANGSIVFKQGGYVLDGNTLVINKIKTTYKFKLTRPYGSIKRISIKKDSRGYLWLNIVNERTLNQLDRTDNAVIGLDFGLKHFLTASDGQVYDMPDYHKKLLKKLKKADHKLSIKFNAKVYGTNYKKAKKARAKLYARLADLRSEFQWKLAHELCKRYRLIAIEDLNMNGMKKLWGRKVSTLAFSEFVNKLKYIAIKYGTVIHEIDRFYASSQTCNICGYKNKETKDLKIREWTCPICGTHHDRDINAAINILKRALEEINSGKDVSLSGSKSKTIAGRPKVALAIRTCA